MKTILKIETLDKSMVDFFSCAEGCKGEFEIGIPKKKTKEELRDTIVEILSYFKGKTILSVKIELA